MLFGGLFHLGTELSPEERRNLVLKLRYGQHVQRVRPSQPLGGLVVFGQRAINKAPAKELSGATSEPQLPLAKKTKVAEIQERCKSSPSGSQLPIGRTATRQVGRSVSSTMDEYRSSGDVDVTNGAQESAEKDRTTTKTSTSRGDFGTIAKSGAENKKSLAQSKRTQINLNVKGVESPQTNGSLARRKPASVKSSSPVVLNTSRPPQDGGKESQRNRELTNGRSYRRFNSTSSASPNTASRPNAERRLSVGKVSGVHLGRRASKDGKNKGNVTKRKSSLKEVTKDESSANSDDERDVTAYRKFREMPKSRPKTICFDYPGIHLTHLDVKRAIERVVPDAFDSGKVTSLLFENVNVKLGTGDLPNRWLIELKDFTTRNRLIKNGLNLVDLGGFTNSSSNSALSPSNVEPRPSPASPRPGSRHVTPKLYDMVAMEEYKLFLRKTAASEKLQSVILLSAGRGQSLLANML